VPTAGTLTLKNGSGEKLLDASAVTIVNGIATHVVSVALTQDEELSELWFEEWFLTIDGKPVGFSRDAALVLRKLYPVVTEDDLLRVHTELREWVSSDQANLQQYLDAAWNRIQLKLLEDGRRPNLILSPGSLYGVHLDLTLALVFRDYAASSSSDGKYMKLADQYQRSYSDGWGDIRFTYDFDEDAEPSEEEQDQGGTPVLFTNVSGWE